MFSSKFQYILHLADNALILAQRNAEWTGHGPVLEQDIAITNISLDLFGQARNFYQYAATLYNTAARDEQASVDQWLPSQWKTFDRELNEDDLAFLRNERQYFNLLLVELPKGDWAVSVLRQFLFSAYQFQQYSMLKNNADPQIAGIAEKSLKEVTYHVKWSGEWVIRLGDGTYESSNRITTALQDLWEYTGEMFTVSSYEQDLAQSDFIQINELEKKWSNKINSVFEQAMLVIPTSSNNKTSWMQSGGKEGKHSEFLGYLLTEMQYLQRTYPNATW